jgi:hypothetical protein
MQANSSESNKYVMEGARSKKSTFLGGVGLCLSIAGLFGVIAGTFVSHLEAMSIPGVIIANVVTFFTFLSVPGFVLSSIATFCKPPRRAAIWGVLLGLVGLCFLPTMLFYWSQWH